MILSAGLTPAWQQILVFDQMHWGEVNRASEVAWCGSGKVLAGLQITRLGSRVYEDTLVRKVDPRGRDYYWIGGEDPVWRPEPGTDFHAAHSGFVSVTPMHLDLTDAHAVQSLRENPLTL